MARKATKRSDDVSKKPQIRKKLIDVFNDVEKGFADQRERSDSIIDNWDAYNCLLGPRQFYSGTSQVFMPLIFDAVEARVTRFVNQIFPQNGRYVEVTAVEEHLPNHLMALLEHYVDKVKLRTEVMPALIRNGDMEGQYTVYVDWSKITRHIARRVKEPLEAFPGAGVKELGEVETVEEEKVKLQQPAVEVVHDADFLVLPATTDSIDAALECGGSVSIIRRWSKAKIRQLIDDGDVDKEAGERLLKSMNTKDRPGQKDARKSLADAAGIKSEGGSKHALVYETWTQLKIDGQMRLCRAYYGGEDEVLGCKLCPYWCDMAPLISGPVKKLAGVFKGSPPVGKVLDLQILANDTINEGADTAHYSAMPIIATDPEKNPRVGSMVLGLAAIWETSPDDTKFMQFPELWRTALERVDAIKGQIFQTLGVNPSMIPQQNQRKKMNQAEIANEQQVDILTTADVVTNLEGAMLSPLLQRFADYDHQFRDEAMTVKVFGQFGLAAQMERIEPVQLEDRYLFKWLGIEAARNAARLQQQIAGLNILKQIPPNTIPGYRINLAPLVVNITENLFGPRLAPLVLEDMREQLSIDPMLENEMMESGFVVEVHPGDDDQTHLQTHMAMVQSGDPHGTARLHIQAHMAQMQAKVAAAAQAQQQGMGGGRGPQGGAQPGQGRGMKGPPGMINQDQMPGAGAVDMPRKT